MLYIPIPLFIALLLVILQLAIKNRKGPKHCERRSGDANS